MPVDTKQIETRLPPPVRAGIGLVAVGVEKAKQVDVADIATLPIRGLGFLVNARNKVERTYEELSNRGETLVARWRGLPEPRQTTSLPEETVLRIEEATPGATLARDALPLADYDHLTLGSLRARLPRLDAVALVQLRDYEYTHANRLPVITMLDNRIAKIAAAP